MHINTLRFFSLLSIIYSRLVYCRIITTHTHTQTSSLLPPRSEKKFYNTKIQIYILFLFGISFCAVYGFIILIFCLLSIPSCIVFAFDLKHISNRFCFSKRESIIYRSIPQTHLLCTRCVLEGRRGALFLILIW